MLKYMECHTDDCAHWKYMREKWEYLNYSDSDAPKCDCGYDEYEKVAMKLLYKAGCDCSWPLIGYRPGVGPRCRLCNTVAKIEE